MNAYEFDVMNIIAKHGYSNQRSIAESTNYSLGRVNSAVKGLIDKQYLDQNFILTAKAFEEFTLKKPKNAIILAAGYGMRMFPINRETPKGLLKIHGEQLIERMIKQLHDVGIFDITVVVGFMKECYEYLIDTYGVELVYNKDFGSKNNIHSLNLVLDKLSNSYVIPCDIWCRNNPFSRSELYSWYMVKDARDEHSMIRMNRKKELVLVNEDKGIQMVGISYLVEEEARKVRDRIRMMAKDKMFDSNFWEEALLEEGKFITLGRIVATNDIFEINTFEELRDLDEESENLNSEIIHLAAQILNVAEKEIKNIEVLKKGMTNRSFSFKCKEKRYIMRIPGEGTGEMINRTQEALVYNAVKGKVQTDPVVYINPQNGYKMAEYLENIRECNPQDGNDVKEAMKTLRSFHELKLSVPHEFDLFERINYYESLWKDNASIFIDYQETKSKIWKLKMMIDGMDKEYALTHIDAVPDNFLFVNNEIRLIDWEYAGMQDPHVDIAMFAIYSLYHREELNELIDAYFVEGCSEETRMKIYAYVAVCGLLWSNWCEYKRMCGVEFGEYSLRQYRYAKEYYRIIENEFISKI
ncbi:MAG: NTP transferase domain-containing protein [Clostridiaceae bacterium]